MPAKKTVSKKKMNSPRIIAEEVRKTETKKTANWDWFGIVAIVVLLALFSFGAAWLAQANQSKTGEAREVSGVQTISYDGITGQTALAILQTKAQIETQESSLGTFVTSINGVANSEDHFWIYYINGEMGTVGADQYQTLATDKIEWRYDKF